MERTIESSEPARTNLEPVYRRNTLLFLLDNILFNLAMNIIVPTTVIPDFIRHLTRSEALIGVSSSLFDVGSTLPQLFVARYLARFQRMKWWFIGPNIPAHFLMAGFAALVVFLGKDRPEAILIAFLFCYGIAALGNGISNLPWWVLAATSLDLRWRTRVLGLTSACVGMIMLAILPLIRRILGSAALPFPNNYALLFGVAGGLLIITILPMMFMRELPGENAAAPSASFADYLSSMGEVLRADAPMRAMVITRILTNLFAMAAPFYIGFATVRLGLSSTVAVPVLLAMQTIGGVSGALLYAWLGARDKLLFIRWALAATVLLPVGALLATASGPVPLYIGFLASGVTVSTLAMSTSNWVITHAPPQKRSMYVGFFNTVSAVVALTVPFIGGSIAQYLSFEVLFVVALGTVLCALFVAVRYVSDT